MQSCRGSKAVSDRCGIWDYRQEPLRGCWRASLKAGGEPFEPLKNTADASTLYQGLRMPRLKIKPPLVVALSQPKSVHGSMFITASTSTISSRFTPLSRINGARRKTRSGVIDLFVREFAGKQASVDCKCQRHKFQIALQRSGPLNNFVGRFEQMNMQRLRFAEAFDGFDERDCE